MTAVNEGDSRGWTLVNSVEGRALRNLFGTFLTGVTVVTFRDSAGNPRGFTANSFTSVSLTPPLILVCIANTAGSYEGLCSTPRFAINILSDAQKNVSAAFAGRQGRRFEEVASWAQEGGPPFIEGSLSCLECQREQVFEAGDHAIVTGRVLGFRMGSGQPLGYYRGGYVGFAVGADALEQLGNVSLRIGCLIESGERVLLIRRAGSASWELPSLPLHPGEDHRQVVPRLLAHLGIKADVGFLYSVYQEPADPHTTLIFRGVADARVPIPASGPDGIDIRLVASESVPWEQIEGPSQRAILKRFFEERAQSRFGIYWDSDAGGKIAALAGDPQQWPRKAT